MVYKRTEHFVSKTRLTNQSVEKRTDTDIVGHCGAILI